MIIMGVIGSETFRLYTERINAQQLFPDVTLYYLGDVRDESVALLQKRLQERGCDVLLVGHWDYASIPGGIKIPCYTVSPSVPDFIQLHPKIKDYSKTAVLLPMSYDPDLTALEEALQIRYRKFRYSSEGELDALLRRLKADGFTTAIGGRGVVEKGQALGLMTHYYFRQVNLEDAVRNALQICRNLEQARSYTRQIQMILENAMCGALYLTGDAGTISYVNQTALTMLQRREEQLLGKSICDFVPRQVSNQFLLQHESAHDLQFHLCGVDVISNIIPIPGQEKGCRCLLFENTSRILQYETMIRQELKRRSFQTRYSFSDIVGVSALLEKTVAQARRFAQSDSTVLINAETGAGKEIFAQSIHDASPRRLYSFVAINCASIPDNLIESELFGYAPGAFTGASSKGKPGLVELANHGTVFLDDIDALSPNFQAKLLRVMQEKEIIRVGGNSPIPVDVRFIVATNRDLKAMVASGTFRNDLYFRVNVLHLTIPPLRSRREDIPVLYRHYLKQLDPGLYRQIEPEFDRSFAPAFGYDYPGNVRELISIAERFVSLAEPAHIMQPEYIAALLEDCLELPEQQVAPQTLLLPVTGDYAADTEAAQRVVLERYLENCGGNISKLSKQLGISRTTLYTKLRKK